MSKLNNLNNILKKKKRIFWYYKTKIKKSNNFSIIHDKKCVNWVFALKLKKKNLFKKIKQIFDKKKIQLDYFWKPLHLQKPYREFKKESLLYSEDVWRKILILPSHPQIKQSDQDKICKIINNFK